MSQQNPTDQPRDDQGRFYSDRAPRKPITLRIDPALERLVGAKNLRQWILQAIDEKLERETLILDKTASTRHNEKYKE